MRRLALALVALAAAVAVAGGAEADAPTKQGWWSKWQEPTTTNPDDTVPTHPSVPSTTTTAVPPSATSSTSVPPPPTGDGGLTVAVNADGIQAVAAMLFHTSDGADAMLYLRAAQKQAPQPPGGPGTPTGATVETTVPPTTAPPTVNGTPTPPAAQEDRTGFNLPPGATVLACPALSPWDAEMNGPYSHAPTWATDNCAPGTVAGGNLMFWTLSADMQDADGNYDIVLVPTHSLSTDTPNQSTVTQVPGTVSSPAPAPYTASFDPPDGDTLLAEEVEEPCEDLGTCEGEGEDEDDDDEGDIEELFDDAGPFDVPGPDGTELALPLDSQGGSLVSTGRRPRPGRGPLDLVDTRMEQIMAVTLLLLMATALWWLGGSPARLPRMVGALADREVRRAPPAPRRGVGRFARERGGAPPRL